MTTIEVLNITYENNRIQECKIIIDGKEFNATWEPAERRRPCSEVKKGNRANQSLNRLSAVGVAWSEQDALDLQRLAEASSRLQRTTNNKPVATRGAVNHYG